MQTKNHKKDFDIIIVGGGHAGLEAACIAAKMGAKVHLLTILVENIALASCNPAMGGLGKGHLIKEIDALGGVMGQISDKCGIQYRILNASKGPAVRGTRAQIDMDAYRIYARNLALNTQNLSVSQEMACEILLDSSIECKSKSSSKSKEKLPDFSQKNTPRKKAIGIRTNIGKTYYADKIIITTGTFLRGLVHIGENQIINGRFGESASNELSESLKKIGLTLGRLKTGTCPRIDGRSIDFGALEKHIGDKNPPHFSYHTSLDLEQNASKFTPLDLPCFVTYTNEKTHKIIRKNFHRAPLFTGQIQGVGPRYCPSIEDKINRFADKERHQLFLEPQTKDCVEYYINGLTTSLPVDIQEQIIHSIKGLENARITRYGYAIEYDFVEPTQLRHTLECKEVDNLYLAGQINGTTGYEEAGALGLMAGINATLSLSNSSLGMQCDKILDFLECTDEQSANIPKNPKNLHSHTANARIVGENGVDFRQNNIDFSENNNPPFPNCQNVAEGATNDKKNPPSLAEGARGWVDSSHCVIAREQGECGNPLYNKNKIDCHDLPLANLAMTKETTTQNQPLKEIVFSRDESYIGVMIDDLVTKGTKEPYRLFTSRAEYRLLLREDNAIYRLLEYAKTLGSISPSDYEIFAKEKRDITKTMAYLESTSITPSKRTQSFLASINQNPLNDKTALVHIVGRFEIKDNEIGDNFDSLHADFIALEEFLRIEAGQKDSSLRANAPQNANQNHTSKQPPNNDKNLAKNKNLIPPKFSTLSKRALHQIQILSKYHNYIQKQLIDVANSNEMLKLKIPQDFEYKGISGLSLEVIEKLSKVRPSTLFEASQISGITPASLDVLHLHIHLRNKKS
ncbi:tRNA uridine-5-carboxymethylaminomethyl(34) synthesis enzyme MnmG [Helicobacter sp. T3_23-1059]